tara:strand:- start:1161 stop:1532 length:372 start_codon:yes stop_codon:yes gene_type:complete
MQIQVNTDHNVDGHESLADFVSGVVESALDRYSEHITRVEVQLSDENSSKKVGHDALRCVMEARLEGRQPIAVTHQATTLNECIDGAAEKLAGMIDSLLGRQRHQEDHRTDPALSPPEFAEEL